MSATQMMAFSALPAPIHVENYLLTSQTPPFAIKNPKLRSRYQTSLTSSEASAEDDVLYMASKPASRYPRSLSPMINHPVKGRACESEPRTKVKDDTTRESVVRDIINKEISEWQNICLGGLPSWESPVSTWTCESDSSLWQDKPHAIPLWRKDFDYSNRHRQRYDVQRRVVTDSYLTDNNNIECLAYLVAIQLLSACFTLPPSHMSSCKSSAYNCFDTLSVSDIPNSRLISSLRMNTEVHYSPASGYEARNTSPSYRWHATYDGTSKTRSHTELSDRKSSENLNRNKLGRLWRKRGTLPSSENSASEYLLDQHQAEEKRNDFVKAEYSRKKTNRNAQSSLSSSSDCELFLPGNIQLGCDVHQYRSNDAQCQSRHQTLEPAIRSKAGHTHIQPVKDMVTKRWLNLRRGLGRRLGSTNSDFVSTIDISMLSASKSSNPTLGERASKIQTVNGSVKERSRHTREWSDIYSNSIISNPRYNTPTSISDGGITSPTVLELALRYLQAPDMMDEEKSIPTVIRKNSTDLSLSSTRLLPTPVFDIVTPLTVSNVRNAPNASLLSELESSISANPYLSNRRSLQPAIPFSQRHLSQRRQRRSMLSESCTLHDIEEQRNAFRTTHSALASPTEEVISTPPTVRPSSGRSHDWQATEPIPDSTFPELTLMQPWQDETAEEDGRSGAAERHAVFRTNRSGSQVFRPAENGIEIHGLPMGPPAEVWDDIVDGIKIRERSFL